MCPFPIINSPPSLTIWKAVLIDNCLNAFAGSKLVGSGDLAPVTGYYRPGHREIRGLVEFHSGEISPRQVVRSRIQPAPAFQIATIVWRKEVGSGV